MTGGEWPPLVPDPPGQEGKLPAIVPEIPSKNVAPKKKVVTMEAGSLISAYHQLEQHRLQPVPVGSESFCKDNPKMKVIQDYQQMDWDLMRVAVPRPKDRVVEGINKQDRALSPVPRPKGRAVEGTDKENRALDGPPVPSRHCTGTVTMVKKKGRKRMTSKKKEQLENRSIFCGPMKPKKKKKGKKSKVGGEDAQEAAVPPKVDLLYFLSWLYRLVGSENPSLEKEKEQEKTAKEGSPDSGSFGRGDQIFPHLAGLS